MKPDSSYAADENERNTPLLAVTNLDGLAAWMLKGPNGIERVELAFKERLQSGGGSRKRHARADTRALPQKQGETGTHELVFGRWCPMSINAALTHNT